jgi:hypothetical protein
LARSGERGRTKHTRMPERSLPTPSLATASAVAAWLPFFSPWKSIWASEESLRVIGRGAARPPLAPSSRRFEYRPPGPVRFRSNLCGRDAWSDRPPISAQGRTIRRSGRSGSSRVAIPDPSADLKPCHFGVSNRGPGQIGKSASRYRSAGRFLGRGSIGPPVRLATRFADLTSLQTQITVRQDFDSIGRSECASRLDPIQEPPGRAAHRIRLLSQWGFCRFLEPKRQLQ